MERGHGCPSVRSTCFVRTRLPALRPPSRRPKHLVRNAGKAHSSDLAHLCCATSGSMPAPARGRDSILRGGWRPAWPRPLDVRGRRTRRCSAGPIPPRRRHARRAGECRGERDMPHDDLPATSAPAPPHPRPAEDQASARIQKVSPRWNRLRRRRFKNSDPGFPEYPRGWPSSVQYAT